MKRDYNRIASFYDVLSQAIFGKSIVRAQQFLLRSIQPFSHVLIVGGGTGWILEELTKCYSSGLQITYVDSSSAMIALSRKRKIGDNGVQFLQVDIRDLKIDSTYNTVITPFVLDNFSDSSLKPIFEKIDSRLVGNGFWLFADFQVNGKSAWWQKPFLKLMYGFFRFCCGIEAAHLPNTDTLFTTHGYSIVDANTYFHDFISAIIYKKPADSNSSPVIEAGDQ